MAAPKDRSLEAFRAWITSIVGELGGNDEDDMTDSEWEGLHRDFWAPDPPTKTAQEPFSMGGPGSGNWGHVGVPGVRGGSQPGAGGPENRQRSINKRLAVGVALSIKDREVEYGAVVTPDGEIPVEAKGEKLAVYWPSDQLHLIRDSIMVHNHVVLDGGQFGPSGGDMEFAADNDPAEVMVVTPDYIHSIPRPEGGWREKYVYQARDDGPSNPYPQTLTDIFRDYRSTNGAYEILFERYGGQLGDMTRGQQEAELRHILWQRIAEQTGVQYSRTRVPDKPPTIPQLSAPWQFGGVGSGNWAHTGLEDLHGGSDPGGGVGTPAGKTARTLKLTEDRIVLSPVEIGVCIDPKTGEQIFAYSGTKRTVNIPRAEAWKLENRILTHNHPSGTSHYGKGAGKLDIGGGLEIIEVPEAKVSFSTTDLEAARIVDVRGMRAVTENWVFEISRPGGDVVSSPALYRGGEIPEVRGTGWLREWPMPEDSRYKSGDLGQIANYAAWRVSQQDAADVQAGRATVEQQALSRRHRTWELINELTEGEIQYKAIPRHSADRQDTRKAEPLPMPKKGGG